MDVHRVTERDLERVRAFLEAHVDTTGFLSSNLAEHGPDLGAAPHSGNFRFAESNGTLRGVCCLTRQGTLLIETGGSPDAVAPLLEACAEEPSPVRGVVGEWRAAETAWSILSSRPGFVSGHRSREVLYGLDLSESLPVAASRDVRRLTDDDFEEWTRLRDDYMTELSLPDPHSPEERRQQFRQRCATGAWWGHPADGPLTAVAGLNAVHGTRGQVGGTFTAPDRRGRGLARLVMETLIEESRAVHRLTRLTLFTGEDNQPARRLYESLGFQPLGHFGLLFIESEGARSGARAPRGAVALPED